MSRIPRWTWGMAAVAVAAAAILLLRSRPPSGDAIVRDLLSEESTARVRAACSTCHVFPEPDILPRDYWPTAVRGMFQIAERRGIEMPVSQNRALGWYVLRSPEQLPAAEGRTDAGPGPVVWAHETWRPDDAESRAPAVTHVQMAPLFGGRGLDIIVSDVGTNRVYALRPYAPQAMPVIIDEVRQPGRVAVTDLDGDGRSDLVVAALGELVPTNDPVGSVLWFRRTGRTEFEKTTLAGSLGRVADVHAADLNDDGRTDLLVAVFGWMENGGLLWLERTNAPGPTPAFTTHVLDSRPGFMDVRAVDLNDDGRLDVVALISQEFQQIMVYWGSDDGFRSEVLFQAPNPDWGFTGMDVTDFTGNGLPDVIVTNGDNLDLTAAKPYHGVGLLENLGNGRFEYHHLTAMYGAHKAVAVDLTGSGRPGLVVAAYLPPFVAERAPPPLESLIWLDRVGPTQLVRRVLKHDGVDHMTLAAGDATGDGRPDLALGFMDLGVVDPAQANRGPPLTDWVSLWRHQGAAASQQDAAPVIDWRQTAPDSGR